MMKMLEGRAVCSSNQPISPLAVCSSSKQQQQRIGGLHFREVIMQKRLGLDLEVTDEFGWFFSGYVTGEGCFSARIYRKDDGYKKLRLRFHIGVRGDDGIGLESIRHTLGIGHLYHTPQIGEINPTTVYYVTAIPDLYHVIIPLFEKYPFASHWRKAREFDIWKELVTIQHLEGGMRSRGCYGAAPLPESHWSKIKPLVDRLAEAHRYSP